MNRDAPGGARPRSAQPQPEQHAGPGPACVEEADPPKIRVVVRKRPINKKARGGTGGV
jgi:hypothetical protein